MDSELPAAQLLNAFTQKSHWPSSEQLYGENMLTLFMIQYACFEVQPNYQNYPTFVPPQLRYPDELRDVFRLPNGLKPYRRRFRPFYSIEQLQNSPAIKTPPRERFDSMCRKLGVAAQYTESNAHRVAQAYYIFKYFQNPREPFRKDRTTTVTEGILLENSLAWAEILQGLRSVSPPEPVGIYLRVHSSDDNSSNDSNSSSTGEKKTVLLALLTHTLPATPPANNCSVELSFALHIQAKGSAFQPQSKIKQLTDMLVHGREYKFSGERVPSVDVQPYAMHRFKNCEVAGIRLCCQKMLDTSTAILSHAFSLYDKAWLYYCDAICPSEDPRFCVE